MKVFPTQGKPTITVAQIAYAIGSYYKSNRTQRMGQFFVNNFMTPDTSWPELWFETDEKKSAQIFLGYLESQANPDLPVSAP